jgi:hypothetical protein
MAVDYYHAITTVPYPFFFEFCDGRQLDLLREVPLKWRDTTLILATPRDCEPLAAC